MIRWLHRIAFSPFFQALIVALLIILITRIGIKKYYTRLVDMTISFEQSQFYFADLDHDGYSERIQTFHNDAGNAGVAFQSKDLPTRQFNFRGVYQPKTIRLITGDYDQDGNDEVYVFTLVEDSLLLHGIEFDPDPDYFLSHRLIARLGKNLKDPDFIIIPGLVKDLNGDKYGELVFAVSAGFSRQPRNIFRYDIRQDSLLTSPQMGAFISDLRMNDLDKDGLEEILIDTYASDNYNEDSVPYHDSGSWLMIFDRNLNFFMPPKQFPGRTGGVHTCILKGKSRNYILAEAYYYPNNSPLKSLSLFDIQGNLINSRIFERNDPYYETEFIPQGSRNTQIGLALAKGWKKGFYTIDTGLNMVKVSNQESSMRRVSLLDIDRDEKDEIILLMPDQQRHLILRDDFKNAVELDFPVQSAFPLFSLRYEGDKPPQLSVQGDRTWKLFDYGIDPLYRFRYMVYIGIYLLILGFIILIRKLYAFQIRRQYEMEKRLASLQLSAAKAQLDPHFIFNVINSIASGVYREQKDKAYLMILKFSNMVRALLSSSDQLVHPIRQEIGFVANFLEMESMRFPGLFGYAIEISDEVPADQLVPRMMIQLHVENALKHGLIPREGGGRLEVSISKDGDYVRIVVRDNGIGRKNSALRKEGSTGKGMAILGQIFEIYNKYNRLPLKQEIIDLYHDDGSPAGTEVRCHVPLEFNERIY